MRTAASSDEPTAHRLVYRYYRRRGLPKVDRSRDHDCITSRVQWQIQLQRRLSPEVPAKSQTCRHSQISAFRCPRFPCTSPGPIGLALINISRSRDQQLVATTTVPRPAGVGGRYYIIYIMRTRRALSLIHISEPTRQAEISYAVFCLKKK